VIGIVVGIFFFRAVLVHLGPTAGGIIAGAVNAVQIQLMNYVYGHVSTFLNEYENHRTPSEFENGLIAKNFLFKFVNSYNALFYYAFFKQYEKDSNLTCNYSRDPSGTVNCLSELKTQLGVIFGLNIVLNNAVEILTPMFFNWWTARENAAFDKGKEVVKTRPEEEYELSAYESTFEDFDELVIQYGYVCLFVVAFPLAPLLALINNYVEIRLDAKKLSLLCRRPFPAGAGSIGTWYDMLQVISFISVITNGLICVFFTDIIGGSYSVSSSIWAFLVAEHIIMGIKFGLANIVDDEPLKMRLHVQRQEYLVDVLINGRDEEDDDDDSANRHYDDDKLNRFTFADVPEKPTDTALAYSHDNLVQ